MKCCRNHKFFLAPIETFWLLQILADRLNRFDNKSGNDIFFALVIENEFHFQFNNVF